MNVQQMTGFTGLLQSLLNLSEYGRRFQREGQFLTSRKGNVLCKTGEDLGKLQRMEMFPIHQSLTVKISGGNPLGIHGLSAARATGRN